MHVKESLKYACVSVHVDAVMKDCDDVWVVTASCRSGDAVSRLCKKASEAKRSLVKSFEESGEILDTRLKNFYLEYNLKSNIPRREWTKKDQNSTRTILERIEAMLLNRRIMRSLEELVGGRNLEMDRRLMQRTYDSVIHGKSCQVSHSAFAQSTLYPAVVSLPSGSSQGRGMLCLHSTSSYPANEGLDIVVVVSATTFIALISRWFKTFSSSFPFSESTCAQADADHDATTMVA
nr:hypothetical protein [Tanacetum cinerariifolium]